MLPQSIRIVLERVLPKVRVRQCTVGFVAADTPGFLAGIATRNIGPAA